MKYEVLISTHQFERRNKKTFLLFLQSNFILNYLGCEVNFGLLIHLLSECSVY